MIKKIVVSSLLIAGVSTFVLGRSAWTYMKTAGHELRQSVKSQVPIEFEVKHAERLVEELVPEIRTAMHVIAEQQVEVEALTTSVEKRQTQLKQQKDAILALRENLDQADTQYVIAGKSYTQQQVEKDLESRFRRYQLAEETFEHEQQILNARKNALQANEDQLAQLIATKKELEAELAQLDARVRAVKAAEAVNEVAYLDDSRLNRAKNLISELNKQLDIKERLLQADSPAVGQIPIELELEPEVSISEKVDQFFKDDLASRPL